MKTDDAECEWCPVKLDASGVYIAPGEWGCCNDACPKTIDKGNNTNTKILLLLPGVPFQEFKMSKLLIMELQSNYKKKILVDYCNDLPITRHIFFLETFCYSFT